MSLIKNAPKPLAKSVLIPLRLTAAASATNAAIPKKIFGSVTRPLDLAKQTKLINCNEKINEIMKILKSLEKFSLWIKRVSETIKNKAKGQKCDFLSMLLGTFSASLLGNLLTGKGTFRAGEDTIRAGQNFYCSLIL